MHARQALFPTELCPQPMAVAEEWSISLVCARRLPAITNTGIFSQCRKLGDWGQWLAAGERAVPSPSLGGLGKPAEMLHPSSRAKKASPASFFS